MCQIEAPHFPRQARANPWPVMEKCKRGHDLSPGLPPSAPQPNALRPSVRTAPPSLFARPADSARFRHFHPQTNRSPNAKQTNARHEKKMPAVRLFRPASEIGNRYNPHSTRYLSPIPDFPTAHPNKWRTHPSVRPSLSVCGRSL